VACEEEPAQIAYGMPCIVVSKCFNSWPNGERTYLSPVASLDWVSISGLPQREPPGVPEGARLSRYFLVSGVKAASTAISSSNLTKRVSLGMGLPLPGRVQLRMSRSEEIEKLTIELVLKGTSPSCSRSFSF